VHCRALLLASSTQAVSLQGAVSDCIPITVLLLCLLQAVRAAVWGVDSVLLPALAHYRTLGELMKANPGHGTVFSQALAAAGMTTAVTSSRFNGTVLMPSDQVGRAGATAEAGATGAGGWCHWSRCHC
jgi:hypothetical protein